MDFCRSTVVVLYEKAVASVRGRQTTFGCFDPRPWFGSKGRVAGFDRKCGKQSQNRVT